MIMSRRQKENKTLFEPQHFKVWISIFFFLKIFHSKFLGAACPWAQVFGQVFCIVYSNISHAHLIYQEKRILSFQKAFQYSKLCTIK